MNSIIVVQRSVASVASVIEALRRPSYCSLRAETSMERRRKSGDDCSLEKEVTYSG